MTKVCSSTTLEFAVVSACRPGVLYSACLTVDQAISSHLACTRWRCSPCPLQCAHKAPEDNSTVCSARDKVTSRPLGPMFDVRWPSVSLREHDSECEIFVFFFSHVLKVAIERRPLTPLRNLCLVPYPRAFRRPAEEGRWAERLTAFPVCKYVSSSGWIE